LASAGQDIESSHFFECREAVLDECARIRVADPDGEIT
jgi:hypothetical protein